MAGMPERKVTGGMLPVGMKPTGELTSRTPSASERLADTLAKYWYGDTREGYAQAQRLVDFNRMVNPVVAVPLGAYDGTRAAMEGRPVEAGVNLLGAAGMLAPLRTVSAAGRVAQGADDASRAMIRRDNVFRGDGPINVSIPAAPTKPYAVRSTGYEQVDDMVASGLVRPKPGGYGKQQKATIYFGEAATPAPTPLALPSPDRVRLIADSATLAGRNRPLPIDELKAVYALRDGKEVDILPDIIRRNRGGN